MQKIGSKMSKRFQRPLKSSTRQTFSEGLQWVPFEFGERLRYTETLWPSMVIWYPLPINRCTKQKVTSVKIFKETKRRNITLGSLSKRKAIAQFKRRLHWRFFFLHCQKNMKMTDSNVESCSREDFNFGISKWE